MKIFKTRKKKKYRIIKYIFLFFFFFSYVFVFLCFKEMNKKLSFNILDNNYNYINSNIIKTIEEKINNIFKKPTNFLNRNVIIKKYKNSSIKKSVKLKSPKIYNPSIYIYNTHQNEKYYDYDVFKASKLLSNMLKNDGFDNYFEEKSIKEFLQVNNLKYYKSYDASLNYLLEAKNKYDNLTYFFDIHRDSLDKEKTTLTYEDKKYAKVLFIIGLDNKTFNNNLVNANILNNIINSKVPNISKGVLKKGGKGVNGIYNQDISDNVFLIEVGGIYNTKEEVENSILIIEDSIIEYIRGINDNL